MSAGLSLVGGGVRSGKSRFALQLAEVHAGPRIFVATAQVRDGEMQTRIDAHRKERKNRYTTIEEPLDLQQVLEHVDPSSVVVVDCLTLWLSNLLLADGSDEEIRRKIEAVVEARRNAFAPTIFVSNEVGMGIVPENALARRFRDLAGTMHQLVSGQCTGLFFATMGIVLRLRPAPIEVCGELIVGIPSTVSV